MNYFGSLLYTRAAIRLLITLLIGFSVNPLARAGLTLNLQVYHNGDFYYLAFPSLNTNSASANPPDTGYFVWSHGSSANSGIHGQIYADGNSENGSGVYSDYASFIPEITNSWTLQVTNTTSTNNYTFYFNSFASNALPAIAVTFPLDGAVGITNRPTYTWVGGPTNYSELFVQENNADYSFYNYSYIPITDTSWTSPVTLAYGSNYFFSVVYNKFIDSNSVPAFAASVPTNNASQSFPGWISTALMSAYVGPSFTVTNFVGNSSGGHTNLAHYSFEDNDLFAHDFSENGNDIGGYGWFGAPPYMTNDAAAGAYAVGFTGSGWLSPPTNLITTLGASFSASVWVKPFDVPGNDNDGADSGEGILSAYDFNNSNEVIPIALTGSKIAFLTGGGVNTTLHSQTNIHLGQYVHVVVTRDSDSGLKKMYINGVLDNSEFSTPGLLDGSTDIHIGYNNDAAFSGVLDDVQIYSGVLSGAEVSFLYGHPGSTVADVAGTGSIPLGEALDAPSLPWNTSGDSVWFGESSVSHDGVSAAQSGVLNNNQFSTLSTTVTGPGTLSFWWQTESDNFDFDLEFDVDGGYYDDLSGSFSWSQGTYSIPAGVHTLTWTAQYADNTNDTGWVDQVLFTGGQSPVITRNPFNQTNYPGYSVALLAAATGFPSPTWQWYKIGVGAIPNATNALYIPANAGTPGVAGSYYAVASNSSGSGSTLTASITFASAPLPPEWSRAFKSPSFNNNTVTEENYLACQPDSAGNLYAVGSYTGTNTLGATTFITANGAYESLVVKQTATGSLIWARSITNNGQGSSFPQCVAPAPGDGLYVAGVFSGTNWLGTNALVDSAQGSTYLARFDANGNNLWVRTIKGTNFNFTGYFCLVSDAAGNATLSALVWGLASFDSAVGVGTNLFADGQLGALAQYDSNGILKWAELPGAWTLDMKYSSGRIYGSMFSPAAGLGFAGITNATDRRFTLASINPTNGQAIWLRGVGAPQDQGNPLGIIDDVPLIAVSGTNITIIGTAFGSNAAFGPYTTSWTGSNGQYFARYDINGNAQLATVFGSEFTLPWAVLADASGNIYVGGDFDTYSTFGQDTIALPHLDSIGNGYYGGAFLAKFDRDGHPLWVRPAQSESSYVNLRGLALASDGIWAGCFGRSPITFGTNIVYTSTTCIGTPTCTLTYHTSGMLAKITESSAPLAVTLINPLKAGANFSFQFLSQAGHTHTILTRTSLSAGSWQTNSTVNGDGSTKTITIPGVSFSAQFFRVDTQ